MKNKIHICFWKTDGALTAKVLDLTLDAKNKAKNYIKIVEEIELEGLYIDPLSDKLRLLVKLNSDEKLGVNPSTLNFEYKERPSNRVYTYYFKDRLERDNYFNQLIEDITNSILIIPSTDLEEGCMCQVSATGDRWFTRKLLKILPEDKKDRFITDTESPSEAWECWRYAKSIDHQNKVMPQITKHVHGTFLNCLWEF